MESGQSKLIREFNIKLYETECIIEPPSGSHEITLIWLHGMTMKASDSIRFFLQESALNLPGTRIVMPQAPERHNTVANKKTASWFDVFERTFEKPFEEVISTKEIHESAEQIRKIVDRELAILNGDSSRLFIAGFSQGCGLAMHIGLECTQRVGGIIAIAGYFFPITQIHDSNKETPMLIIHGKKDTIRPWEQVKSTYDELLKRRENHTEIVMIPKMGHEFLLEPVREKLTSWINSHAQKRAGNL